MLYSYFVVKDCTTRLENIAKKIKEDAEGEVLTNEIPKIIGIMLDLIKGCEENLFFFEESWSNLLKLETIKGLDIVFNAKIGKQIKDEVEKMLKIIPEDYNFNAFATENISSHKRSYLTDPCPLKSEVISDVFDKCLGEQTRPFNLLDVRCKRGSVGEVIKNKYRDIKLYGIENELGAAEVAKKHYIKVAKGTISGAKISNEVFDILYLTPEFTFNLNPQMSFTMKAEKMAIYDTNKYIRPDGLFMLIIPYFRLYKDVCYLIARYYRDIKIFRLYGDDWRNGGRVLLTGIRKKDNELDPKAYNYLREYKDPVSCLSINNNSKLNYKVPGAMQEVKLFRGSILDHDEMARITQTSGLMDNFLSKQNIEKTSQSSLRPLQPFNIGQIGLVLTSGCLDGIVDEGDGSFHAIKGRVAKKTIEERRVEDGRAEIVKTISNKVEINVVLPDGTYKTLA